MTEVRTMIEENGNRTHEPSLRELTAELDGLRDVAQTQTIALRDHVDTLDRLYSERDKARATAVDAALLAQEKLVNAAFAAAQKANDKYEEAQRDYNKRSNEFRGTLDDQAKLMLTRKEAEEKYKTFDIKDEELRRDSQIKYDDLRREIQNLRESRAGTVAKEVQVVQQRQREQWSTTTILYIVFGVLGVVFGLTSMVGLVIAAASGHLR
jgi:hypothetical protein